MSLNSVNTNVGARTALRQLGATRGEFAMTQRRVATGLRVGGVKDNGASWAIAQKQRGDVRSLNAIMSGLQRSQSAVDVAIASGEAIHTLLMSMKEKALAACDEGLNTASRSSLSAEFEQLRDQITRVVASAQFDGLNLIDQDAEEYDLIAGLGEETKTFSEPDRLLPNGKIKKGKTGTQIVRSTITVGAEYLYLNGPQVKLTTNSALSDPPTSKTALDLVQQSLGNVAGAVSRLGVTSKALQKQQVFLTKLQDATTTGIGNLVDADLGKESAKLQAIQVKEKLGIQALGIANRAPQTLLGLFRN